MYVLIENDMVKKYPYSSGQLVIDNPNTSFSNKMSDERLAEWNVYPVTRTTPPAYDSLLQNLIENTPVQVNDQWTQVWEVVLASEVEIEQRKQEIKEQITQKVQQRLDNFAQTRGYDNIMSACSYASSQHPKCGPEGRYCLQARETTWDKLFEIEAEVLAGTREMPRSYEEIEPELPVLEWPN